MHMPSPQLLASGMWPTLHVYLCAPASQHGLYKVETIGDAFMCVGGAPDACDPKDAAVRGECTSTHA